MGPVSESVVLNSWTKTDILPPFLKENIIMRKKDRQGYVKAALGAPTSSASDYVERNAKTKLKWLVIEELVASWEIPAV